MRTRISSGHETTFLQSKKDQVHQDISASFWTLILCSKLPLKDKVSCLLHSEQAYSVYPSLLDVLVS